MGPSRSPSVKTTSTHSPSAYYPCALPWRSSRCARRTTAPIEGRHTGTRGTMTPLLAVHVEDGLRVGDQLFELRGRYGCRVHREKSGKDRERAQRCPP